MRPEAISEAQEWLARAELDLQLAERALRIPPALAGGAAYHVQQAAEKALKAFLAAHDEPFPLTHNLTVLLPLCEALDAGFGRFSSTARSLTPYATQFRYPGGPIEPAVTDAEQGLREAAELVESVRRRLNL
jgi:HEPN domain-containing protein